jgi:hypothetical protein
MACAGTDQTAFLEADLRRPLSPKPALSASTESCAFAFSWIENRVAAALDSSAGQIAGRSTAITLIPVVLARSTPIPTRSPPQPPLGILSARHANPYRLFRY